MNFDAGSQFSVGQLVGGALGSTILGVLLALLLGGVLHAVLHATGALQIRKGAEPKFSWWLAVLAVGLGAVLGGWTGLKVGVARAVIPVAKDLGPKMVEESLQQALRGAGMTNFTQLDVKQLRELVDKAGSAPLPPLEFPGAEQLRPQIEAARTSLRPAVMAMLDSHDKNGKLSLNEVVTSLWPKVLDQLTGWERGFRRTEIKSGTGWVVGIQAVLAVLCLTLRLAQKQPIPKPLTPPKL